MQTKIICVDLDASLIKSDTLYEMLSILLKRNLFAFFKMLWLFLLKGRTYGKHQLALCTDVSAMNLPVNKPLLDWLYAQKAAGDTLYLVTAADQVVADEMANQIPIFEAAFGSTGERNLKGDTKRDFLDSKFGVKNYHYVGDSSCDLSVFAHAEKAIVVSNNAKFIEEVKKVSAVTAIFSAPGNTLLIFLKAMRVHQYAKNALIFLPILLSHHLNNIPLILSTLLGFISFSLAASSAYLLNDLLDLQSDRLHPTKCKRPFASGELSLFTGSICAILCFSVSIIIAIIVLPIAFMYTLIGYFICTLAYSFLLKKRLLIDVFTLAILYTVRIIAGMTIIGRTGYSYWLLLFSFCFFLSLAFIKRYNELKRYKNSACKQLPGRAYKISQRSEIKIFGLCSGFASILILALYVQSQASLKLYHRSEFLFFICPILLYWLLRAWLIATHENMDDDPVIFALKDRVTYVVFALIFTIALIATV